MLPRTALLALFAIAASASAAIAPASAGKSSKSGGHSSAASLMYPNCIRTSEEYAAAYANPDPKARARCVDKDLLSVISLSFDNSAGAQPSIVQADKALIFYGGHDALEKYQRIGFPEAVGDWTGPPGDENFPGLQTISNGQALLTSIGFASNFLRTDLSFTLTVVSAKAIRRLLDRQTPRLFGFGASFGPAPPTGSNLIKAYNAAFGLNIPPSVGSILSETSFADLTGCPAECDYIDPNFPTTGFVPVLPGTRDPVSRVCQPKDGAEGFDLTAPSFFEIDAGLCNKVWNDAQKRFSEISGETCSYAKVVEGAGQLATDLENASSDKDKAIIVRAFAENGCFGDFNPLNTFNGYTATGFGGLFAQTVSEFISSPFDWAKLPKQAYRVIDFCISGKNGGRPVGGKCEP
jgi:hypothetical protein